MKITIEDALYGRGDYGSILKCLDEERVLAITKGEKPDEFLFFEKCDENFAVTLTKEQVRGLAAELLEFIEHDQYCDYCGQPADELKCWDRADGFGWRDMRGKKLCLDCRYRALRYACEYG